MGKTHPTNLQFPEKLQFLFRPYRYKVAYGGRGGAKSWNFARTLILLASTRPLRILCAREYQISIQESVHRLISNQISAMGLDSYFEIQKQSISGVNGSEFIFSGIKNNPTKIKSTEGINICWVEEAEKVSDESWGILIPTIREPKSEIWISFNPDEASDPTYQRFVENRPPDCFVRRINWRDNKWFPDTLRVEKDYLARIDPDAYQHIWEGDCRRNSDSQVLRGRYRIEPFEPQPGWDGPYYGADWGFSVDPTALIRCWVKDRTLYVESEAYGIGVDLDDTPALFDKVPECRTHVIRADSARPETISFMKSRGFPRMIATDKWPGSVEDGVEHLRSYEQIIIHSRCKHTAEEARLWSYKRDRLTGDVMPQLADKHNHTWDAIRYALSPRIRQKRSFFG